MTNGEMIVKPIYEGEGREQRLDAVGIDIVSLEAVAEHLLKVGWYQRKGVPVIGGEVLPHNDVSALTVAVYRAEDSIDYANDTPLGHLDSLSTTKIADYLTLLHNDDNLPYFMQEWGPRELSTDSGEKPEPRQPSNVRVDTPKWRPIKRKHEQEARARDLDELYLNRWLRHPSRQVERTVEKELYLQRGFDVVRALHRVTRPPELEETQP